MMGLGAETVPAVVPTMVTPASWDSVNVDLGTPHMKPPLDAAVGFGTPANAVLPVGPGYISHYPGPPIQTTKTCQGPDGCNLFIFHIPNHLTNVDLYNLFVAFGNVISARIMVENETGRSRGFGFVSFDNRRSAVAAIKAMNGYQIGRKRLKVQHKKERSEPGALPMRLPAPPVPNPDIVLPPHIPHHAPHNLGGKAEKVGGGAAPLKRSKRRGNKGVHTPTSQTNGGGPAEPSQPIRITNHNSGDLNGLSLLGTDDTEGELYKHQLQASMLEAALSALHFEDPPLDPNQPINDDLRDDDLIGMGGNVDQLGCPIPACSRALSHSSRRGHLGRAIASTAMSMSTAQQPMFAMDRDLSMSNHMGDRDRLQMSLGGFEPTTAPPYGHDIQGMLPTSLTDASTEEKIHELQRQLAQQTELLTLLLNNQQRQQRVQQHDQLQRGNIACDPVIHGRDQGRIMPHVGDPQIHLQHLQPSQPHLKRYTAGLQ